jgi:sulfur carrier protein
MKVTVNGDEVDISGEISVTELLKEREVKMPDMVSVELNGEILERGTFPTTTVKEADKLEFLYFMGGGQ